MSHRLQDSEQIAYVEIAIEFSLLLACQLAVLVSE